MRLRSRGNQPEQTVPDLPVPSTAQQSAQAADLPPRPDVPPQQGAGVPPSPAAQAPAAEARPQPGTDMPQPGAGMVQPPDADMAPIPAQDVDQSPAQVAGTASAPAPATDAGAQPGPGTSPRAAAATHLPQHKIRRTRVGGVWVGMALAAVVLLLLLVFILENGQKADIGYFGVHGHLPLGVALLLAALAGALLVLIPGSARILQLRKTAKRHRKLDAAVGQQATPPQTPGT